MAENQNINQNGTEPRKIRKIKRVRPMSSQPVSYGMPSKVNTGQTVQMNDAPRTEQYFADNGEIENLHFITEEELNRTNKRQETISGFLKNKTVLLLMAASLLLGLIFGSTVFAPQQASKGRGLDGVVFNSDVPSGRSRCGLVEPHQGCVLYIMNPKNQEVLGKDFYTTAAQWTQRQRYLIETGNMHYSSVRIKPGYIAQINIPPLSNQ